MIRFFRFLFGRQGSRMKYDDKIAAGIRDLDEVRQFQELFPAAENTIVQAKRCFDPDGWRLVPEWISRAHLYDRYVLWFVVAVDFAPDGAVSAIEEPELYLVEIEKGGDDKDEQEWECSCGQLEEGVWKEIVEAGGDFAAIGIDVIVDAPVDRFATFWRKTRPTPGAKPGDDEMAFNAPLRFML